MKFVQFAIVLLPWGIRRWVLRSFFGAQIKGSARVGFSIINSAQIELGDGATIGHFNMIKGLSLLRLGNSASIGHRNWISGYPLGGVRRFANTERMPSLDMGDHSALTQSHRLDCSDAIIIGEFSIVAGYGTQVLTHAINVEESRQEVREVRIGAYTFVGTRAVILPGSELPAYSILAAGAVLANQYQEEYCLYGGVPAKPIKPLSKDLQYFGRRDGHVD